MQGLLEQVQLHLVEGLHIKLFLTWWWFLSLRQDPCLDFAPSRTTSFPHTLCEARGAQEGKAILFFAEGIAGGSWTRSLGYASGGLDWV